MKPLAATMFGFPSPNQLFLAGERGAWYDPTDGLTVFGQGNSNGIYAAQNPASATPIALILDKSQGLAATPTAIDGNLNTGTWVKGTGWTATDGRTARVDGSQVANSDLSTATHPPVVAGFMNRWTFTISGLTGGSAVVFPNNSSSFSTSVNGTFQVVSNAQSNCIFRATAGVSYTISGVRIEYIAGWHAFQNTLANRPTWTQSGGKSYLAFNGTTNYMQTQAIDLTGTGQVSVFAGVGKLSDASYNFISEFSANSSTTPGTFYLSSSASGTANLQAESRGATTQVVQTSTNPFTSPVSVVASMIADLTTPNLSLRVNGTAQGNTGSATGGGNFSNSVLNIGARNGASLFLSGNLYSLIVRGAASNAAEIVATEQWINQRVGAY